MGEEFSEGEQESTTVRWWVAMWAKIIEFVENLYLTRVIVLPGPLCNLDLCVIRGESRYGRVAKRRAHISMNTERPSGLLTNAIQCVKLHL